jgi:hypothetical protein
VAVATTCVAVFLPGHATGTSASAQQPESVAVPQASVPTFATWSSAQTGLLGTTDIGVTYGGITNARVSTEPDVADPTAYNPPGSASQQGIVYPIAPGSITVTFDEPVTNVAIYTWYFRGPGIGQGPDAYRFLTDGVGAWVRVSGNGLVAGDELFPRDGAFISNIMVFDGTLSTFTIQTLGPCTQCGSDQGFVLASLDTVPYPSPSITTVGPGSGPAVGGTIITLTGEGFFGQPTVTIGGTACTEVNVIDELTLTCVVPAGTTGPADVTVSTPGGTITADGAFTYVAAPTPTPTPTPPPNSPATTPRFTG